MILVIGAGAVGTILATYLSAAGREVGLYTRDKDIQRFQSVKQMRVDPPQAGGTPMLAPLPKLVRTLDLEGVECVLLCVKYPDLAGLLAQLPQLLPARCTLVSTLNGVAPLRLIREQRPDARVVPMSIMMNSQLIGPLHARLTTRAEIVFGSDDSALLAQFSDLGLTVKQAPGDAGVWGKLLINLANSICALTRTTFHDLFTDADLRRVYVAVLDEATATMDASDIAWKLPLVIPYPAYRWMLLHGGPLPWWFAKYRNGVREGAYPSMVADVEAGRVTEVAQLNGEVVRLGHSLAWPVPVNTRLVELIGVGGVPAQMSPRQLREALGI